jgi:hypothetical protein
MDTKFGEFDVRIRGIDNGYVMSWEQPHEGDLLCDGCTAFHEFYAGSLLEVYEKMCELQYK